MDSLGQRLNFLLWQKHPLHTQYNQEEHRIFANISSDADFCMYDKLAGRRDTDLKKPYSTEATIYIEKC